MPHPANTNAPNATDPNPAKPRGCTNFKLRQLLRRVAQLYDNELAAAGLKTTQYSLLSHVHRLGPVQPGVLAKAMTLDASTLTRNLKPLVAAGWLALDAGPDARSRLVRITESGQAKRAQAQRCWRLAQDSLNQRLGLDQVQALHGLIDGAMRSLEPTDDIA